MKFGTLIWGREFRLGNAVIWSSKAFGVGHAAVQSYTKWGIAMWIPLISFFCQFQTFMMQLFHTNKLKKLNGLIFHKAWKSSYRVIFDPKTAKENVSQKNNLIQFKLLFCRSFMQTSEKLNRLFIKLEKLYFRSIYDPLLPKNSNKISSP